MLIQGIIRPIDDLGRIVIPKEYRIQLGLKEGQELELVVVNDVIIIGKARKETRFEGILQNKEKTNDKCEYEISEQLSGPFRMRTIKQAIKELKARDAELSFTETALRKAIKMGLPHLKVGNKILVDLDIIEKYLLGEITLPEKHQPINGIRPL